MYVLSGGYDTVGWKFLGACVCACFKYVYGFDNVKNLVYIFIYDGIYIHVCVYMLYVGRAPHAFWEVDAAYFN